MGYGLTADAFGEDYEVISLDIDCGTPSSGKTGKLRLSKEEHH